MTKQFPRVEDLVGADFRAVLIMVLLIAWTCTGFLESLHATIRRLIMTTSVHTHMAQWQDVNSGWLMGCYRRLKGRGNMLWGTNVPLDKPPGQRKRKRVHRVRMSDGNAAKPKPTKIGRVGGAWAFLRTRLWECGVRKSFKTLMPDLQAEYHALPADDLAKFARAGDVARLAGHVKTSRHTSSFGPRPRDLQRESARALKKNLQHRTKVLTDDVETLSTLNELQQHGGNLTDVVSVIRHSRSELTHTEAAQIREDALAMKAYEDGPGRAAIGAVQQTHPGLDADNLVAIPTEVGHAVCLQESCEDAAKQVGQLVSHWNVHCGGAMSGQVDNTWAAINRPVREADCEYTGEQKPPNKKCNEAGMCLCVEPGKTLHKMRSSFSAWCTKPYAPKCSPGWMELKQGYWSFLFRCYTAPGGAVADSPPVVLHAARDCLSPWRPTWHQLEITDTPAGNPPAHETRVYTKA